jgi:hypothetical protein
MGLPPEFLDFAQSYTNPRRLCKSRSALATSHVGASGGHHGEGHSEPRQLDCTCQESHDPPIFHDLNGHGPQGRLGVASIEFRDHRRAPLIDLPIRAK